MLPTTGNSNGKRRYEGLQGMSLPYKRPTTLFPQWRQQSNNLLTPHSNVQSILEETPLGLNMRKTPSFLDLIGNKLCKDNTPKAANDLQARTNDQKLKAANMTALSLRIGDWQYKTTSMVSCLTAKIYYSKRKAVWEILHCGIKYKMEFDWSDITNLNAEFPINGPETLTVYLGKPPVFYKENDPQPKKHAQWHSTGDFTNGEASKNKVHILEFPSGVLEKHFTNLIKIDGRLKFLSRLQEPVLITPFFNTYHTNDSVVSKSKRVTPPCYNLHDIFANEQNSFGLPTLNIEDFEILEEFPVLNHQHQQASLDTIHDDLSNPTYPILSAFGTCEEIMNNNKVQMNSETPLELEGSSVRPISIDDDEVTLLDIDEFLETLPNNTTTTATNENFDMTKADDSLDDFIQSFLNSENTADKFINSDGIWDGEVAAEPVQTNQLFSNISKN